MIPAGTARRPAGVALRPAGTALYPAGTGRRPFYPPSGSGIQTFGSMTVADNAAQGTTIFYVFAPSGYTLNLDDSCEGCFQLVGNQLQVGATTLWSGYYFPVIGAYIDGSIPTSTSSSRLSIYPIITATPVVSPADVSGLTYAWDFTDVSSMTFSGSNIMSVAGAFGTSNAATGGGAVMPILANGTGPRGASYVQMGPTGRPRFTIPTTGAMTSALFAFVGFTNNLSVESEAMFGNTNSNNYVAFSSTVNAWASNIVVRGNAGTAHTAGLASNGLFDNRAPQILLVDWNGTTFTPYCQNAAGGAIAHTDPITITQLAGLNTSFNFLGGMQFAGIWPNKGGTTAAERTLLFRALNRYRGRDFFFSSAGNDSNTGWNVAAPKLSPVTFSADYKTAQGTRFWAKTTETFPVTSVGVTWPLANTPAGLRGGLLAYDPATGLPPTNGSKAMFFGATVNTSGWSVLGGDKFSIAPGFTPLGVWVVTTADYSTLRVLVNATGTAAADTWEFATGTLTVHLEPGEDANALQILIGRGTPVTDTSTDRTQYMDIAGIGAGGGSTGVFRNRGNGAVITRCIVRGSSADSFNLASSPPGGIDTDCIITDVGPGSNPLIGDFGNTNYDAHTMHGGSWQSYGLIIHRCWWHGMAHQMQSPSISYSDLIMDVAGIPARLIANGANNGTVNLTRFYISRAAGSGVSGGIVWDSTCGGTVNAKDGLVVGLGLQRGKAFDLNGAGLSGGTFNNLGNVSQTGFNSLT